MANTTGIQTHSGPETQCLLEGGLGEKNPWKLTSVPPLRDTLAELESPAS